MARRGKEIFPSGGKFFPANFISAAPRESLLITGAVCLEGPRTRRRGGGRGGWGGSTETREGAERLGREWKAGETMGKLGRRWEKLKKKWEAGEAMEKVGEAT